MPHEVNCKPVETDSKKNIQTFIELIEKARNLFHLYSGHGTKF